MQQTDSNTALLLLLLRTSCLSPTCLQHDIMLCNSCELSNTNHFSIIIHIHMIYPVYLSLSFEARGGG